MVLGSNRRQRWVSGRAVYARRTNGNCSVITWGGGGGGGRRRRGGMMRPVIKRSRQAVGVGGRCDSGQILLTEPPVSPPSQGRLSEETDGG